MTVNFGLTLHATKNFRCEDTVTWQITSIIAMKTLIKHKISKNITQKINNDNEEQNEAYMIDNASQDVLLQYPV